MNVGIVVEDIRDGEAYRELIKKIREDVDQVLDYPCHGVDTLRKISIKGIRYFQYHSPHLIGKALVICDSDCSNATAVETELEREYKKLRKRPKFHVHFHATKCELESWLLVDEGAINRLALERGKRKRLKALKIDFESRKDSKELFRSRLTEARLPDTPEVYTLIARYSDIKRIRSRCPNFQKFTTKINAP
jgi:hypothetical protein